MILWSKVEAFVSVPIYDGHHRLDGKTLKLK